jgi:SagB-type dehydrogenase family enzyme
MSKAAWVLLPLVLAAAVLAWLALRGRWPGRLSLNVVSSLLLLVYMLTTAGLGIFWVANQHLPVFDWHYLFGYATVLLLALHLAFNLPVVWRWWGQRKAVRTSAVPMQQAPAAAPARGERGAARPRAAMPRRRWLGGALGAVGVLASSGFAFFLGLRHGRTELHIGAATANGGLATGVAAASATSTPSAPSAAQAAAAAELAWAVVEQFHAFSGHSRAGVFRRAPAVSWGAAPPPFKTYAGVQRLALPGPAQRPQGAAGPVAAQRPGLQALADLLWHTAGVSEVRGGIHFRTSPSSGALFSTELYLWAASVPGLSPGLWHYAPAAHALHRLGDAPASGAALGLPGPALPHGADTAAPALQVLASAVFRRSGHKYGDRAYRYVLADLGHTLENLRVAAGVLGWRASFEPAFDGSAAAATLALDEAEEGVLALVTLWPAESAALAAPASADAAPVVRAGANATQAVPAAAAPAAPAAMASAVPVGPAQPSTQDIPAWQPPATRSTAPLGVTDAIHRATSLRWVVPVPAAPAASLLLPGAFSGLGPAIELPAPRRAVADPLRVIAKRRSVRRFTDAPLALTDVSGVLDAMLRRHPPLLSTAVRLDLVVHAVQGLAPGSWRYQPHRHALIPGRLDGDLRARSRRAALDQDVIGDAAAVLVLSIARAALASDPAGPARGYRHAFLEAGLVGERLYLDAGARGLGVCAVGAFYDDEAAQLVAVDPAQEWIVHFAALGVPS